MGPLLTSSWPLLAFSWPFPGLFWPLPGLFWPLPGLFLASSGPFLDFSWILQNLQNSGPSRDVIFLFIKHCVSSSFFAKVWIPGVLVPFFEYSAGLFLASSWPLPGLFWPLPGLFWPLPGLFSPLPASSGPLLASSWPLLASLWPFPGFSKISKIRGPPETSFSVHNTLRFELFFAKFWIPGLLGPLLASSWPLLAHSGPASSWPLPGLFWPLPGLSWPLPSLFWPLPGLFWPLFGFLLDSPKSPKFRGPQRRHFLFIKHCVLRIFFTLWPFPLPGLFRASSGLFLASSWPFPGLFRASSWPLLASLWAFFGFSKISKIQGPPDTSFSVHKTLRFEQFFAKFWIPGFLGPLLASSWPLLAFSWPLPDLFWPLLGLFWPLPGLFWPLPGLLLASSGPFLDFSWILQNLQNSGPSRDVIFCS